MLRTVGTKAQTNDSSANFLLFDTELLKWSRDMKKKLIMSTNWDMHYIYSRVGVVILFCDTFGSH